MQRIFKILMQGPLEEDFNGISTRSSHKDLYQIIYIRTPRGFHHDLFESFSQGPVQDHAKASGSISLGSPQELRTKKS